MQVFRTYLVESRGLNYNILNVWINDTPLFHNYMRVMRNCHTIPFRILQIVIIIIIPIIWNIIINIMYPIALHYSQQNWILGWQSLLSSHWWNKWAIIWLRIHFRSKAKEGMVISVRIFKGFIQLYIPSYFIFWSPVGYVFQKVSPCHSNWFIANYLYLSTA